MNVFHHDLEAIETLCLCGLDFVGESLHEVLVHDTIGSGEKSKDKMKWHLSVRRLVQSWTSFDRSISSTVQNDASAFLYICQSVALQYRNNLETYFLILNRIGIRTNQHFDS